MPYLFRVLRLWIPLTIAIVCGSLGLYVAVQQTYRMNADDPQIALAEDGAHALLRGQTPTEVAGTTMTVDPSRSLSPFVVVYDTTGTPVASSGVIDTRIPKPPSGVLEAATVNPSGNRITWEPVPGVRIATVVYSAGDKGYVLAGRSLSEVEWRIAELGKVIAAGGAVTAALTLVVILIIEGIASWMTSRKKKTPGWVPPHASD